MSATADGEAGFSLIESAVSLLIMALAVSVVLVTVSTFVSSATAPVQRGQTSESAQLTVNQVYDDLEGVVTPYAAAAAAYGFNASGVLDVLSTYSSPCWGGDPANPSQFGNIPASSAPYTSIEYAGSFEIQYCGYAPFAKAGSAPGLYEIEINSSTCVANSCSLQLYDGTTSNGVTTWTLANTIATHLWCDSSCQSGSAGTSGGSTPALFTYFDTTPTFASGGSPTNGFPNATSSSPVVATGTNPTQLSGIVSVEVALTILGTGKSATTNETSASVVLTLANAGNEES